MNKIQNIGILILRITVGVLMLFHGIHKWIYGHDFIIGQLKEYHLPTFLWIGVPIAEVFAPIGLIIGFCTRISSILIITVMLMAIILAKGMTAFQLNNVGALEMELQLFYILTSVCILCIGSGKYSLFKGRNKFLI